MAFCITKTHHNGYRCGCCRYESRGDPVWVQTLEEALAEFPTGIPEEDSWGGLYAIEVIDGSTGEKIAWGDTHWPVGYGTTDYQKKYSGNRYTCWTGYRPDTGAFEFIRNRSGEPVTGKSWSDVIERLADEQKRGEIVAAQKALEDAQKALQDLSTT